MKFFIAFAVLVAGVSALPPQEKQEITVTDPRLVTGAIVEAIQDISQSIKDAGLDPLYIKRESYDYALPVPVLFNGAAYVEEILSNGLSNIVINNINYGVITSRLTFDIELPLISASVDDAAVYAVLFGSSYTAKADGGIAVQRIRVRGEVRISIGIISGIFIRSLNIDFSLGGVISDVNLSIQGNNYSGIVNTFFGTTIPTTLKTYAAEINELLEIVLLEIIEDFL